MTEYQTIDHDVLVIGAGGAGLRAAIEAATDGVSFVYLADVYVLAEYRGRGLGEELVREMVDGSGLTHLKWLLHTSDMHPLYRKLGFDTPTAKVMERLP